MCTTNINTYIVTIHLGCEKIDEKRMYDKYTNWDLVPQVHQPWVLWVVLWSLLVLGWWWD